MIRLLLITISLLCTSVFANNLEYEFENSIAKTISYVDNHQEEVWPGFKLGNIASISLIQNGISNPTYKHLYAIHFQPIQPEWQSILLNNEPAYYLDHDIYQFSDYIVYGPITLDNQDAFIIATLTEDLEKQGISNLTFNFANIRFKYAFPNTNNHYYIYENSSFMQPEAVKLRYLELEILKQYFQASIEAKESILKDALATHQYRLQSVDEESANYLKGLDLYEGAPSYAGWKSQNLIDKDYLIIFNSSCDLSKLSLHAIEWCENTFATGLAYGLELDRYLGSQWKVDNAIYNQSIENLLIQKYGLSNSEITTRVQTIINNNEYGYNHLAESIDSIMTPQLAEIQKIEADYQSTPGIEILVYGPSSYIESPTSKNFSRTTVEQKINKNIDIKIYDLTNFLQMITNCIGYFSESTLDHKSSESFYFTRTPLLYTRSWSKVASHEIYRLRFKVPADAWMTIDGHLIQARTLIKNKKTIAFAHLTMETKHAKIVMKNLQGTLDANTNAIQLRAEFP